MVIRRAMLVAPAQAPARRTPATPQVARRRQSCIREITQTWDVYKYRDTRRFVAGQKVTVYSPDMPTRDFLVEFYPGLRLKISEDELEQFTKEI
jgi:hypothetical protein